MNRLRHLGLQLRPFASSIKSEPDKIIYKVPNLTVDAIVVKQDAIKNHWILLIQRAKPPFAGCLAFPGGFVDYGEDPKKAVLRELQEECSITGSNPQLITVAGEPDRDPRKHIVTIAYHVEVDPEQNVKAADDAASAQWYPLKQVYSELTMAFDHKKILQEFLEKKLPQYL